MPSADVVADVGAGDAENAIAVAAVDDRFEPACIVVDVPGAITLVVRNAGRHPHNLTMAGGDRVSVDAGQVAILTTSVAEGGARYTCTIHEGMDGELRVRE